jgi:hypothetical protein
MESMKRTTADTGPMEGAVTTTAETPHHQCDLSQGEAAASLNVLSQLDRLYVEIQHERSTCEWLRS